MPYSSSTEMDYFGRYGPSVRTESMPPVFRAGVTYGSSLRDERLEQIALHMEYYMNYRGKVAAGWPRQSKGGSSTKGQLDLWQKQTKAPLPTKRSVSVPAIPTPSILKSPCSSKCSSPKGKKIVRFADTQGLPLETIHQKSDAEADLLACSSHSELMSLSLQDEGRALKQPPRPESPPNASSPTRQELEYHFVQPGIEPGFMKRVLQQKVCLENIRRDGGNVHGVVRVNNIDYHKCVSVRWTSDHWRSIQSQPAVYCSGSSDSVSDRFSFQLPITGGSIEFAVCFQAAGQEFWDNNKERNYVISVRALH